MSKYSNVYYLIKLFIKKVIFYEQLRKSNNRSDLANLFANSSILLAKKILLINYRTSCQGNQIVDTQFQPNNNEHDLVASNENIYNDIVEKQAREIEIDYNQLQIDNFLNS